jgi:hypothetical protein
LYPAAPRTAGIRASAPTRSGRRSHRAKSCMPPRANVRRQSRAATWPTSLTITRRGGRQRMSKADTRPAQSHICPRLCAAGPSITSHGHPATLPLNTVRACLHPTPTATLPARRRMPGVRLKRQLGTAATAAARFIYVQR